MSMLRGTVGLLPPLRDIQMEWPKGYCRCCQAELYDYDDDDYCPKCLEERNGEDRDP